MSCRLFIYFVFFSLSLSLTHARDRQILEEHRRNCERQGKYVEAEIAKNRIEELRRQYPLNYFHVSPLSFCFDFAACHPFQPCVWLRTSGSTLLTCRIQLGNTFSVFFFSICLPSHLTLCDRVWPFKRVGEGGLKIANVLYLHVSVTFISYWSASCLHLNPYSLRRTDG
mmetsp:Transcript_15646/g.39711  ORF Transcript_15646/g.39711 Transcript_15646/m.39711 type:complete len:169 (+) Transcript_15646:515-1021(+)